MVKFGKIQFESCITRLLPSLTLGVIVCDIKYSEHSPELWNEICSVSNEIRSSYLIGDIKEFPTIMSTREAYKICGKDPTRYRPSAEQLHRRILQGKDLYQISTIVDLVNLVSLRTGYSIGGFDAEKIVGSLSYGIGVEGEQYEAIGRGKLNIAGMPVLRDSLGGIGTPTSDEMRTRVTENTARFLMNINAFEGRNNFLVETIDSCVELLKTYASGTNFDISIIHT